MVQTYIRKDHYGKWRAETEVPLEGQKVLCLHTSKDSRGGLTTRVSVCTLSDDGKSRVHAVFSDYNKAYKTTDVKRVTVKAIEEQHAEVLANLEAIKAEVVAYYLAKEPACSP